MSSSDIREFSDEKGSWKIICISRRRGLISRFGSVATLTSLPSAVLNMISPLVGSIARRRHREVVVLPQPLSPTRPRVSPVLMSKLTSSTGLDHPDGALQKASLDREVLGQIPDL